MPEIIVRFGDKIIDRLSTEKKTVKIGRDSKCDIFLDNPGVSRLHAELNFFDDYAFIIDKESTNGTYVNGKKVTEAQIGESDVVTIGQFNIRLRLEKDSKVSYSDFDRTMVVSPGQAASQLRDSSAPAAKTAEPSASAAGGAAEAAAAEDSGVAILMGVQNADFTEYRMTKKSIIIGKGDNVDIKVKGLLVAPVQTRISQEKGNFVIANVGKRKLTTVNGREIYKAFLKPNDTVQVGKTIFTFTKE